MWRAASAVRDVPLRPFDPPDIFVVGQRHAIVLARRIRRPFVERIRLGPQVREHVMADARFALVADASSLTRPSPWSLVLSPWQSLATDAKG